MLRMQHTGVLLPGLGAQSLASAELCVCSLTFGICPNRLSSLALCATLCRRRQQVTEAVSRWIPCFSSVQSKPPSLPQGWPSNVTAADLAERPYRIVNINAPQDYRYADNFVKTSAYEW